MALFVLSDLHLSFSTDKPMNIFRGWDDHTRRIEKNWKALVAPEDTVVLPGDLSWAMKLEQTLADFQFIDALPGNKIILKGNHDLWWTTKRKMELFLENAGFHSIKILYNNAIEVPPYCICGTRGWFFDDVPDEKILAREAGRLERSLQQGAQSSYEPLVFMHYPPFFAGQVCDPFVDILKKYGIDRVYCGHIHSLGKQKTNWTHDGITVRLASCDCVGFTPISIPPPQRSQEK